MVELKNTDKFFGKSKKVLAGLNLTLRPGRVYGLIGINGAGKTTLIRLICGLLAPDAGSLRVLGRTPDMMRGDFYRELGVALEQSGFNENLTFAENLRFFGRCRRMSAAEVQQYSAEWWPDLTARREPVRRFSRGQKVLCGLARAFLGFPPLLLLDEPTNSLDPAQQKRFARLIRAARTADRTILISSHQGETIQDLCDTTLILKKGQIRTSAGACRVLMESPRPDQLHSIAHEIALPVEYTATGIICTVTEEAKIPTLVTTLVRKGAALKTVRVLSPTEDFLHDE
ncbi:MAG: ABC transporter ATP-binding protein [Fibrobacterota bacterium]